MFRKYAVIFVICGLIGFGAPFVGNAMTITLLTDINLNQNAVNKGATVGNDDKSFQVSISPRVFKKPVELSIRQFDFSLFNYPDGWTPVSDVYEFQFSADPLIAKANTISVKIATINATKDLKQVFGWDKAKGAWIAITSETVDVDEIKATISGAYGKIVVLANDKIPEVGVASWYAYKKCDCAASPDYPKGTKLKVTNLDNGKSIVVKVNDFGPERDIFPDRVIDLDKVAFAKIGSLRAGILKNVKVTPIVKL